MMTSKSRRKEIRLSRSPLVAALREYPRVTEFDHLIGKGAHKIVYKGLDTETSCEIAWNAIGTANMQKSRPHSSQRRSKESLTR